MIFKKKNSITNQVKKIDKLVTGLIIGGAIASMIGLSKAKKGIEVKENMNSEGTKIIKKGYSIFGKVLVKIISVFNKK